MADRITFSLPRPGPALKAILILLGGFGLLSLADFPWSKTLAAALACTTDALVGGQVWRLVTSALVATTAGHLLFSMLGIYLLGGDLEERWGSRRFLRFALMALVCGNIAAVAAFLGLPRTFEAGPFYGPGAVLAAVPIAWARENANRTVLLFFIVPVRAKWLLWLTLVLALGGLLFPSTMPEGRVAIAVGALSGLALGGTPSPLRIAYLRLRVAWLRRGGRQSILEAELDGTESPKRRPRAAHLRAISGGLEDDLRSRKPRTDKRFLN